MFIMNKGFSEDSLLPNLFRFVTNRSFQDPCTKGGRPAPSIFFVFVYLYEMNQRLDLVLSYLKE